MQRMEGDLGSRLDWIAVDHWDTDNPHTHIVLRGVDETGQNLVIAREYISHGMRRRAAELATEWLGPRTEREIRTGLEREVTHMRWTSLDRTLADLARDGAIDLHELRSDQGRPRQLGLLVGRLQHLEAMGLATITEPGRWRLRRDVESVLRAQGELGDIVRTMQRALGRERREHRVFDPARASESVVGRVAGKGLADELRDRGYLVVDGVDGKGHYVRLPASGDLSDWPVGGIVEVTPTVARKADGSIARLAVEGLYRPDQHLAALRSVVPTVHQAEEIVAGHVRRLEALRRAGIVEWLSQGVWRVPADIMKRGHQYDVERLGGAEIQLRSHLPIGGQVHAGGATWLDRQLAGEIKLALSDQGFGPYVRSALRAREDVLLERGLAERHGQQTVPVRALVSRLSAAELDATAQTIATETGLHYRPAEDHTPLSGVCRRSLQLASGRFVMLDNAMGFTLVPWRPVLEKRTGQSVTAVIHGDHVTFQFGRQLGR
jgi:type IV secretory pathway VirD2 relaxase